MSTLEGVSPILSVVFLWTSADLGTVSRARRGGAACVQVQPHAVLTSVMHLTRFRASVSPLASKTPARARGEVARPPVRAPGSRAADHGRAGVPERPAPPEEGPPTRPLRRWSGRTAARRAGGSVREVNESRSRVAGRMLLRRQKGIPTGELQSNPATHCAQPLRRSLGSGNLEDFKTQLKSRQTLSLKQGKVPGPETTPQLTGAAGGGGDLRAPHPPS